MKPRHIFFKEPKLDERRRFTFDFGQNDNIDQVCFSPGKRYFIKKLKDDVKFEPQIEKLNDYNKIDELSKFSQKILADNEKNKT